MFELRNSIQESPNFQISLFQLSYGRWRYLGGIFQQCDIAFDRIRNEHSNLLNIMERYYCRLSSNMLSDWMKSFYQFILMCVCLRVWISYQKFTFAFAVNGWKSFALASIGSQQNSVGCWLCVEFNEFTVLFPTILFAFTHANDVGKFSVNWNVYVLQHLVELWTFSNTCQIFARLNIWRWNVKNWLHH